MTEYSSTVNLCFVDLSKAFDNVNHSVLVMKLPKKGLPICFFIRILLNWYDECSCCVKWGSAVSRLFLVSQVSASVKWWPTNRIIEWGSYSDVTGRCTGCVHFIIDCSKHQRLQLFSSITFFGVVYQCIFRCSTSLLCAGPNTERCTRPMRIGYVPTGDLCSTSSYLKQLECPHAYCPWSVPTTVVDSPWFPACFTSDLSLPARLQPVAQHAPIIHPTPSLDAPQGHFAPVLANSGPSYSYSTVSVPSLPALPNSIAASSNWTFEHLIQSLWAILVVMAHLIVMPCPNPMLPPPNWMAPNLSLVHSKILVKLSCYGIGHELLEWVLGFLTGRTQRVIVDNILSEPIAVGSGVVQGSMLGPLVFILFINDIVDCLDKNEVNSTSCYIFAVDFKLYTRPMNLLRSITL